MYCHITAKAALLAAPLALAFANLAHAQPQPRYEGNRGQAPTSPYGSLYLNRFFFDTTYHVYSRTPDRAREEYRRALLYDEGTGLYRVREIYVPAVRVLEPTYREEFDRPVLRPGVRPDLTLDAARSSRAQGIYPDDPVVPRFRLYDYDLFGPGERYDYGLNRTRTTDPAKRPDNNFYRNHPNRRTLPRR